MKIIVFEGFDFTGKTTMAKEAAEFFGYTYMKCTSGVFAQVHNQFDQESVPVEEKVAFYIACMVHVSSAIQKARDEGVGLIIDRYFYTVLAYFSIYIPNMIEMYGGIFQCLHDSDLVIYLHSSFRDIQKRMDGEETSVNDKIFITAENHQSISSIYKEVLFLDDVRKVVVENKGDFKYVKDNVFRILLGGT